MAHPYLIVIQGAPGTGKTTLAKRLSNDLGINCFSKDSFKEMLYDTIGIPASTEQTKLYGRISIRAMYVAADEYMRIGQTVMVEAPLEARFAQADLAELATVDHIIQIHVTCDLEEQVRRFHTRRKTGARHEGHPDDIFTIDDARAAQTRNDKLPGFTTFTIDTTTNVDTEYEVLLTKIKGELS